MSTIENEEREMIVGYCPAISKHLRVLRETGLVIERKEGRQRFQSFNGAGLAPLTDWVRTYEDFWDRKLAKLKAVLEEA